MGAIRKVQVVDLELNNLGSLVSALRELDLEVLVISNGEALRKDYLTFLPGTGNFASAVKALDNRAFRQPIIEAANAGARIVGVCLGAQLLLGGSQEGPGAEGLGLIDGESVRLTSAGSDRVPVLGWRRVKFPDFQNSFNLDWFYFAHSYEIRTNLKGERVGFYERPSGEEVTAMISKNHQIVGIQFHPEKSGPAGLRFLHSVIDGSRN
jgi:imidazole glycerol phosphate synthase glutamine amidotransferase subunit